MRAATALVVASATTWSCAPPSPTYPTPVQPQHGVAAIIDLTAQTAGSGPVSLAIGVMDAYRAPVQTTVELQASAGALSSSSVTTNSDGRASATLTAPAGTLTVTARAGAAEGHTLVTITPTVVLPPVTPPLPPQPPPSPDPGPDFPLSISINTTIASAGSATRFGVAGPGITSAAWTFGDGSSGTGASTSHVYANPNTYPVSVTVQDTRGRSASASATVHIPAPPPPPEPPQAPLVVVLQTQPSATSVPVGGTLTFTAVVQSYFSGESITMIEWDLDGDGKFESVTADPAGLRTSTPYTTPGLTTAQARITTNLRTGTGTFSFVVTN